jgi:hypothetical protein
MRENSKSVSDKNDGERVYGLYWKGVNKGENFIGKSELLGHQYKEFPASHAKFSK